ncbi:MAG TPA: primosomal protein N' [Arcobacter sp.]|jgi:primosomal protein N' (replication factor Y)|nr:primosomal protein N' [Arcobacter sp.]
MNYYEIALLKSPLEPLTYQSLDDIKIGHKVSIKLQNRTTFGVIIKQVEKPSFKTLDIVDTTDEYYDDIMLKTAQFIALYYVCSLGEALSIYTPFYTLNPINKNTNLDSKIELSPAQSKAFEFTKNNKASLLFANTGSGKTEIYIKAIEEQLLNKKQAVLLMPEIALTPQMNKRLEKIFGDSIAIWHSKIQKKKKESIIKGLLEGSIKIIAGARSALFLPFSDLGLIIVDEEHDDSYKSDQKPRMNVKDLSIFMGTKFDTKVILGSATPSLSSFVKVPYYRLKETFFSSKKQYSYDESSLGLTPKIVDKISKQLEKQEQTIIFLPTRANFKYQICDSCAKAIECPFCSVSLSLHKNNKALKCHYCNYTQAIVEECPSCQTGILKNFRLGTVELLEQLQIEFPNKTIKTFDRDSVKTTRELNKILKEFNDNKIDILIGTQMISKGHDYHNVTLAIIMGIDSLLQMASYKVREKTLALALQIAGRSGRNGFGEVLLQTKNQEFFQEYLEQKDYKEFLEEELDARLDLYPPKIRLAKITFSHKNGIKAQEEMLKYVQYLSSFQEIELVGYKESSIFKIANKYRYEILVRSKNINQLLQFLHSIDCSFAAIDMDTLS